MVKGKAADSGRQEKARESTGGANARWDSEARQPIPIMERQRRGGPDILSNQVCVLLRLSVHHSMTNSASPLFALNFFLWGERIPSAELAVASGKVPSEESGGHRQ